MARTDVWSGAERRGAVLIVAMALPCAAARAQLIPSINQMSYTLDGVSAPYQFTEWGNVAVTYTPTSVEQYFNLNVNGVWVVQNMPVVTREGIGSAQIDNFQFDLGAALGYSRGTSRIGQSVGVGYTVTTVPTGVPALGGLLNVTPGIAEFSSGIQGAAAMLGAGAGAAVGGAAGAAGKSHRNFPNQEVGNNECAPGAVSNSLRFLKDNNPGAAWGSLPLDIATMRTATGCGANGSPVNWSTLKNTYMAQHGYPIMTMDTNSFADVAMAIMNGKDVELTGGWHCAAVVGITDLGDGKWSLQVAHDTNQGPLPAHAGGTQVDTITWNPTTMKFSGSPGFFDGSQLRYFTVEMVPAPGAVGLLALAGLAAARRRRLA